MSKQYRMFVQESESGQLFALTVVTSLDEVVFGLGFLSLTGNILVFHLW